MVLSPSRASLSNKHDQSGASRSNIYAMTTTRPICTRVTLVQNCKTWNTFTQYRSHTKLTELIFKYKSNFVLNLVCRITKRVQEKNFLSPVYKIWECNSRTKWHSTECNCEWRVTRVGTLIVATIYLQMIQNRYVFRSFTVLQCSHQHCVQPVASNVEVIGYL